MLLLLVGKVWKLLNTPTVHTATGEEDGTVDISFSAPSFPHCFLILFWHSFFIYCNAIWNDTYHIVDQYIELKIYLITGFNF